MRLTIQKIRLENFKGKRSLEMEFNEEVTRVYGANRTGKTTIADAITWCLFGKDSKGRTQFGIKTRDERGEEIPHLPHSVTMEVMIDQEQHTIQRVLVEQWTKQHGSAETTLRAHTTECYVDGVKYTVRDYQSFVAKIVSEDTFRMLTTPTYFPSMAWEEQRRALVRIAGQTSPADIIARMSLTKEQTDELLGILAKKTIIEHTEHLSYQMKTIKPMLEQIPTRMDEVSRSMPERPSRAKEGISDEIGKIISTLSSLGNTSTMKPLADRLSFLNKRRINIEQGADNKVLIAKTDRDKARRQMADGIRDAENNIQSLRRKIQSLETYIKQTELSRQECFTQRDDIREEWARLRSAKFQMDEDSAVCPTCGQPLPEDQLRQRIAEMRENFNKRRADRFAALTKKADAVKQTMEIVEKTAVEYAESKRKAEEDIRTAEETLATLRNLAAEPEEPLPTKEDILSADANYASIINSIADLEKQMEELQGGDPEQRKAEEQRLREKNEELNSMLRAWDSIEKCEERLEELRVRQKELNTQLSALERQFDIALAYQMEADSMLEEQVNKMFSFVNFRMFRTLINGTRQPYCEAMVGGIPYADLNRADQINAGIDIINTLSNFHDVFVPLVIDNAEAINKIIQTKTQNIQLYVSEEEHLTVR